MFNWREIPLVRVFIPFAVGILLSMETGHRFPVFDYLLVLLLFLLSFLFKARFHYRFRWVYGLMLNLFFLVLAYQLCFYHTDLNRHDHFRSYLSSEENLLIGEVVNVPLKKEKQIRIQLEVYQIDSIRSRTGQVLISVENDGLGRTIAYGDHLICRTRVKNIESAKNPKAFDYKKFLHLKNIDYQGFVKSGNWKILDSRQGNPLMHLALAARAKMLTTLEKYIHTRNELSVASALIVGYKESLSPELKASYANTGAMHVLAVSGLHVGLIWGILAFALSWIRWRHPAWKWIKTMIIVACLWGFALITGASPSVLRAAAMFTFLIIGNSLDRSVNIYNTLAASALVLLFYNPFLIGEVGFQLSYLAVIGIVYFYPKIYRLWYIENRLGQFVWKLTAVAMAAQLTTFPISLFYFHQFPVYFWLSGLVVVPFAFLILGGGIVLFVLELILPFLAHYFSFLLYGAIWLMNALIFLIEQLPAGLVSGIWISGIVSMLLYIMLINISISINTKKFKWLLRASVLGVLISGMLAFEGCRKIEQKEIVFYNIYDKTYVESIDGRQVMATGDFNIPKPALRYARANYHSFKRISKVEKYHFGHAKVTKNNWIHKNGFVQFYDKKIACIKALPETPPLQKINVDFLLIRKKANLKISDILDYFQPGLIVLDASLPQNELMNYKRGCIKSGIDYYDVRAEGALIYKW